MIRAWIRVATFCERYPVLLRLAQVPFYKIRDNQREFERQLEILQANHPASYRLWLA